MEKSLYVFDSNIFIGLQRRQPIDIYPSLWNQLGELMDDGVVISSQEVFEEIALGGDNLESWAKHRKERFLLSEIDVQEVVRTILTDYRGLIESGKKKNSADPFVIALAHVKECSVVTEEIRSNNLSAPKIPDICIQLNVGCMNFVEFAREVGFKF